MRTLLLLSVSCLTAALAAAETNSPSISITQDGTLAIQGSAEVPRYAQGGNWTEMIWRYAYVFVRQPSLTFLTLRPQADARASIEDYLRGVRLK